MLSCYQKHGQRPAGSPDELGLKLVVGNHFCETVLAIAYKHLIIAREGRIIKKTTFYFFLLAAALIIPQSRRVSY